MENIDRELRYYTTRAGRIPFLDWLQDVDEKVVRAKVDARLALLEAGNLGKCRSVGEGIFELKIDFGPGYRVYFGQDGVRLVILLMAGDKSTQSMDILVSRRYWVDYKARKREGKS
jgi:putative addiction module killer protein